jgi:hypothetical protein
MLYNPAQEKKTEFQILKSKWIEALRSGRYKQAQCILYDGHGRYCCLGVLAVLMGRDVKFCNANEHYQVVREVLHPHPLVEFMGRNDGTGWHKGNPHSFAEIADYIEENL